MELELPDLVEWNEKWKKEIDDLSGIKATYILLKMIYYLMN